MTKSFKPMFTEQKKGSSADFFRLTAKNPKVTGVFRGDIVSGYVHWVNKKPVRCAGKNNCPLCEAGDRATFLFKTYLIVMEEGKPKSEVFSGKKTLYDNLASINKEIDITNTPILMTREITGTAVTDVKYMAMPVQDSAFSKEVIESVELKPIEDFATQDNTAASDDILDLED